MLLEILNLFQTKKSVYPYPISDMYNMTKVVFVVCSREFTKPYRISDPSGYRVNRYPVSDLQSVAKVLDTLNGITFHDGVL